MCDGGWCPHPKYGFGRSITSGAVLVVLWWGFKRNLDGVDATRRARISAHSHHHSDLWHHQKTDWNHINLRHWSTSGRHLIIISNYELEPIPPRTIPRHSPPPTAAATHLALIFALFENRRGVTPLSVSELERARHPWLMQRIVTTQSKVAFFEPNYRKLERAPKEAERHP